MKYVHKQVRQASPPAPHTSAASCCLSVQRGVGRERQFFCPTWDDVGADTAAGSCSLHLRRANASCGVLAAACCTIQTPSTRHSGDAASVPKTRGACEGRLLQLAVAANVVFLPPHAPQLGPRASAHSPALFCILLLVPSSPSTMADAALVWASACADHSSRMPPDMLGLSRPEACDCAGPSPM